MVVIHFMLANGVRASVNSLNGLIHLILFIIINLWI